MIKAEIISEAVICQALGKSTVQEDARRHEWYPVGESDTTAMKNELWRNQMGSQELVWEALGKLQLQYQEDFTVKYPKIRKGDNGLICTKSRRNSKESSSVMQ